MGAHGFNHGSQGVIGGNNPAGFFFDRIGNAFFYHRIRRLFMAAKNNFYPMCWRIQIFLRSIQYEGEFMNGMIMILYQIIDQLIQSVFVPM